MLPVHPKKEKAKQSKKTQKPQNNESSMGTKADTARGLKVKICQDKMVGFLRVLPLTQHQEIVH